MSFLKKILLLITILIQTGLTFFYMQKVLPFEIQSLLDENNPIRVQYENDLKRFPDENYNWILIEKNDFFDLNTIEDISKKIGNFLEMTHGIESIIGPHNAKFFRYDALGIELSRFIKSGKWTVQAEQELKDDLWKNLLINENFKSFLITFKIKPQLDKYKQSKVIREINNSLLKTVFPYPGVKFSLLGAKIASAHFLSEMQFQQKYITPFLLILICIFLYICFRSFQVVLWSLFTLFMTYTSTLVLIIFKEGGLGPYSSFALMFSFIVSTTDLIHFFGRYQQVQGDSEYRLKKALKISWFPCLLTSLTTAAGFFALVLNHNLPVRNFGLYCAFGSIFEWAVIFYILPFFLRAFNFEFKAVTLDTQSLSHFFRKILNNYSHSIVLLTFMSLFLGIYYSTKLKIDDNFYTKFKDNHPLSQSIESFSRNFNFVGSINLILKVKQSEFKSDAKSEFDPEIFSSKINEQFRLVESAITLHPEVSRISSLSQIYSNLRNKISPVLNEESSSNRMLKGYFNLFNNYGMLSDYYNDYHNEYRTTIYLKTLSTEGLNSVLNLISDLSIKFSNDLEIRPSGFSVIRSYINGKVIKDFFESFILSFLLIFACYLWLFRSIKWSLLALIPNLIPLLAVSGLLGLFSVMIDTNLVILICVAFGIAGDNTVHLTYVIQQKQKEGKSYPEAIDYAFKLIGVPMIATNAIFLFCLPVFLLGSLKLFIHISFFLSSAFIVAFLADVFMFPALQMKLGWSIHEKDFYK